MAWTCRRPEHPCFGFTFRHPGLAPLVPGQPRRLMTDAEDAAYHDTVTVPERRNTDNRWLSLVTPID